MLLARKMSKFINKTCRNCRIVYSYFKNEPDYKEHFCTIQCYKYEDIKATMKQLSKEDYEEIVYKQFFYRPRRIGKFAKTKILQCKTCGIDFEVSETVANNGRKYCNKKCVWKY